MAGDLNSGFKNNINVTTIRTSGTSLQRSSNRPVDLNGDGIKEIRKNGVMDTIVESDGGVNTSGNEFTEGNG